MDFFKLNNGVMIPAIGSGTNSFGKETSDFKSAYNGDFSPLFSAIDNGYTMFDCAKSYGNESGMGDALRKKAVDRKQLFLIGKIPNKPEYFKDRDSIRACLQSTLNDLGTDYLDLYLIHQPISYENQAKGLEMNPIEIIRVYSVLEDLYREGLVRSIGVANFTPAQLETLMCGVRIVPAVNQFRSNPCLRNKETIEFCRKHGILPMAHSPMNFSSKPGAKNNFDVNEYKAKAESIGKLYGKTWGQVLLRWNYQSGICSIPKSHNKERQYQNLDIFNFRLTEDEMNVLGE